MSLGIEIFLAMSERIDNALPITVYCESRLFLTDLSQSEIKMDAAATRPLTSMGFGFDAQSPIFPCIEDTNRCVQSRPTMISASYNTIISPVDLSKISFHAAAAPLLLR